ncbi:MAG: c-type cytochrome [Planctomycetes bacterium]|nr:c-type cytochrome [Planctomycetota bacterium]
MQLAALKALARIDLAMAAVDAGKILAGNNHVNAAEVIHIFLARSGGSQSLAKALSVKTLSKAKAESCLQAIQAYGRSDKELTAVFENAIGVHSQIPEYNLAYLKALAQESIKYGNTENGKMVFLTTGCIACHQVGDSSAVIGPDLSSLGPAMHIERIVEEVLWPRRSVKEGYDFVTVTTKDGVIHQGYKRKSKDQEDVYLMREMATTVIKEIPRDQIVSVKSSGSAMIPGIVANLKREDLRDLIKYLSTLGTTK